MLGRFLLVFGLVSLPACGGPADPGESGESGDAPGSADRTVTLGVSTGVDVPALHGHYDLSGVLHTLSSRPGLTEAMGEVGFPSWRVSLGRWELFTLMTDEGTCAAYPDEYLTPSLEAVLDERDWFVLEVDADSDGQVDLVDTEEPANYRFAYLDSVLDEAAAFGAQPFISVDYMPRALSSGVTFDVVDCTFSFANGLTNAPPRDPEVYASAVAHVIAHVVNGWGGGAPRDDAQVWEFGNEPDLPAAPGEGFWSGTPEEWLTTYAWVAAYVAAYREVDPTWADVRIGGGSFATDGWNEALLQVAHDAAVPVDFLSVHRYADAADDHLATLADARATLDAWSATDPDRFGATDLVLAEWGADLAHIGDADFQDAPSTAALHAAVLTGAVDAGLAMTHRSLFSDLYGAVPSGIVRGDGTTTGTWEVYRAFDALAGGDRLATPAEVRDGGTLLYTVLASRRDGVTNVLLAHVAGADETVAVELGTTGTWTVQVLDPGGVLAQVGDGEGETALFALPVGTIAWVQAR